jgi:hypothetical protein
MTSRYLVLFDADRIREYVFATGRLREIRGASEMVRQLVDAKALETRYPPWEEGMGEGLIYAGGGAGALLFASEGEADACVQTLEGDYRRGTAGASLTAVAIPVPDVPGRPCPEADDPALNAEERAKARRHCAEAEAQTTAARALARRKQDRAYSGEVPGGLIRFCASDRLHPASRRAGDPRLGGELLVSEATARKWEANDVYRDELPNQPYWDWFLKAVPGLRSLWEIAFDPRQELGHIGKQAAPEGYVAFVHVDGDRIGSTLKTIVRRGGFAGYQAFSSVLTDAAHEATGEALAAAYGGAAPREVTDADGVRHLALPFEVITVGGDDILLVCTAERGLEIATAICREFGRLVTEQLAGLGIVITPPITASAGVVIAHATVPIPVLKRGAYDLLREAKKLGGAIDFQIVSTPGLDSLERIRQREYQTAPGEAQLTKRPYPLEAADTLLAHAGIVAETLPNTRVAELYRACRGERLAATLAVLSVHERLDRKNRDVVRKALRELESNKNYPFDAKDAEGRTRTALVDLLEASRFVAPDSTRPRP